MVDRDTFYADRRGRHRPPRRVWKFLSWPPRHSLSRSRFDAAFSLSCGCAAERDEDEKQFKDLRESKTRHYHQHHVTEVVLSRFIRVGRLPPLSENTWQLRGNEERKEIYFCIFRFIFIFSLFLECWLGLWCDSPMPPEGARGELDFIYIAWISMDEGEKKKRKMSDKHSRPRLRTLCCTKQTHSSAMK